MFSGAIEFYRRWAVVHQYDLTSFGVPHQLDEEGKVFSYVFRAVKKEEPRKDKPIPWYRKGSPE